MCCWPQKGHGPVSMSDTPTDELQEMSPQRLKSLIISELHGILVQDYTQEALGLLLGYDGGSQISKILRRHGRTDPPPEPTSSTNPVSHPQWAARSATWWRSAAPELAGSRDPPAVERERSPSHPPRHPNPTARPYPGVLRVSLAMRNTVARLTPNCFPSCMRGMPASKSCCSHTVWTTSTWW